MANVNQERLIETLPPDIGLKTLPERIAWLDTHESSSTMTRSARKKIRKILRLELATIIEQAAGPTSDDRAAARSRLRLWTCSDCWQEVAYVAVEMWGMIGGPRGVSPAARRRLRSAGVYPPGGANTAMKACRLCNRETPPNCIRSSGACDDCAFERMTQAEIMGTPGSISTTTIYQVHQMDRNYVRSNRRLPEDNFDDESSGS